MSVKGGDGNGNKPLFAKKLIFCFENFLNFCFGKTSILDFKKLTFLLICPLSPKGGGDKGLSGHVR